MPVVRHQNPLPTKTFEFEITATGSTQATARPIQAQVNVYTSVPVGSGALLGSPDSPVVVILMNKDPANTLNVYPPGGWSINLGATNSPVTIAAGSSTQFVGGDPSPSSGGTWFTV